MKYLFTAVSSAVSTSLRRAMTSSSPRILPPGAPAVRVRRVLISANIRHEWLPKPTQGDLSVRKEFPREVSVFVPADEEVVLDADAARRDEPVHERPVERVAVRPRAVRLEQHRDEVKPGLDREEHALLDDAGDAESRM